MADVTFSFRLEAGLRAAFSIMAEKQNLSPAQLLRRMMREVVDEQEEAVAHERWQRREIDDAMHEADATRGLNLPNVAIDDEWQRRKAEIIHGDR